MRVRFEQVESREKESALIRATEKTADILNAIYLIGINRQEECVLNADL